MKYLPKYPIVGYLLGGKVVLSNDEKQLLHEECNRYMLPEHAYPELYARLNFLKEAHPRFDTVLSGFRTYLWCCYTEIKYFIKHL